MLKSYIYFPEELDEKIKAEAKKTGKSKAAVIREAVAEKYQLSPKSNKSKKNISLEEAFASLAGSVVKYKDPFKPVVPPNDWEALK